MKADDPVIYPPSTFKYNSGKYQTDLISGLTIRDYIAIKMAQAMLQGDTANGVGCKEEPLAEAAYLYADALIAESEKK
jgi:hypothetical protein